MKIKDQVPSDNIDDNPSGWRSKVSAKLTPDQTYKVEPPDAVQATGQHSNLYEKTSSENMQRTNHRGKKSNENRKRNRETPKGLSGGW